MKADTQTIRIMLNGKPQEIRSGMTVTDLLTKWRMRPELVTVEINETILQKLDYESTQIKTGDKVEFIFYMGGGAPVTGILTGDARRGIAHKCKAAALDLWGSRAAGPVRIPVTGVLTEERI